MHVNVTVAVQSELLILEANSSCSYRTVPKLSRFLCIVVMEDSSLQASCLRLLN